MSFLRILYPGAGTEQGFAGELSPDAEVLFRRAAVLTTTASDGPVFGRGIADAEKRQYRLNWRALSHAEAQSVYDIWVEAGRGSLPLYYTPDDETTPVTVIAPDAPVVTYLTANTARVEWALIEQR